jgi:phosphate/sulfate permease
MYIFFQAFSMIDSVLFDAWNVGITYVCTNITAYISNGLLQVGRVYWLFYIFLVVVVLFIVRTVKRRIRSDEI